MLTARQLRAIELLADGKTEKATAAALKVARQTIARWTEKPDFDAAFRIRLDAASDRALRHLQSRAMNAARRVSRTIDDRTIVDRDTAAAAKVKLDGAKTTLNRIGVPEKQEISVDDARRELAGLIVAASIAGGEATGEEG
jgi:hypothetical protein